MPMTVPAGSDGGGSSARAGRVLRTSRSKTAKAIAPARSAFHLFFTWIPYSSGWCGGGFLGGALQRALDASLHGVASGGGTDHGKGAHSGPGNETEAGARLFD